MPVTTAHLSKSTEKPNLDFMRSVAILLVVTDHTAYQLGYRFIGPFAVAVLGLAGVYMFFVHTCMVLMWSLQRKPHTLDFYIRRAFRIYPLAIAAVLVVMVLPPLSPFFFNQHVTLRSNFADLLLMQNLFRGGGVAIGVLWSLPLEVDMYVLLPLLYFFVRKNFSLWPLLVFWSMAVAFARFNISGGNNFLTVIPCFLPGVMGYVLFERSRPRIPAWLFPVFLAALTCAFLWGWGDDHASHWGVAAAWPTCLILGLATPFFRQITLAPLMRASLQLAKYSYGIYLTHSFGLMLAFRLSSHSSLFKVSLAMLMTAILSLLAYHLLEKPMIDLGARVAAKAETRYEQNHPDQIT